MRSIVDIKNEYMATYRQGLNLKTKKASQKKFDRCHEIRMEFRDALSALLSAGDKLTGVRFGVTGVIGGAGAVGPQAVITVLDVYTQQIVVGIPTQEYPNGEVFKIDFLDGWMGELNLNALLTIKQQKVA